MFIRVGFCVTFQLDALELSTGPLLISEAGFQSL
jgi:hypothetical protein